MPLVDSLRSETDNEDRHLALAAVNGILDLLIRELLSARNPPVRRWNQPATWSLPRSNTTCRIGIFLVFVRGSDRISDIVVENIQQWPT